jgi:hypothetical protein
MSALKDALEAWFPQVDWGILIQILEVLQVMIAPLVGLIIIVSGIGYAYHVYRKRTFYDLVTYSLNGFEKVACGKTRLKIRTQLEGQLSDFLPSNRFLDSAVRKAAKQCDYENMFMHVNGGSKRSQELFLNSLVSHWIAKVSAEGDLAKEMGLETVSEVFWVGVTFEPYERPPIRKIRVMGISEKELTDQVFKVERYVFEKQSHADRIHTLSVMKLLFMNPARRCKYLMRCEITLRK